MNKDSFHPFHVLSTTNRSWVDHNVCGTTRTTTCTDSALTIRNIAERKLATNVVSHKTNFTPYESTNNYQSSFSLVAIHVHMMADENTNSRTFFFKLYVL